MEQVKVSLSANAGVCIEIGGRKIWVDALFSDVGSTFSALDPSLREWVFSSDVFASPDYICYTHLHEDHYCEKLTRMALEKWPDARLVIPTEPCEIEEYDLKIEFVPLPHAGAQYADVALWGILITAGQTRVLLPGDCEVASPALAQWIGQEKVDIAILDFPWITLRRGQEFLAKHIKTSHIIAYHLPFAQDDVNGYRKATERAVTQLAGWDIVPLWNPMQTEIIKI